MTCFKYIIPCLGVSLPDLGVEPLVQLHRGHHHHPKRGHHLWGKSLFNLFPPLSLQPLNSTRLGSRGRFSGRQNSGGFSILDREDGSESTEGEKSGAALILGTCWEWDRAFLAVPPCPLTADGLKSQQGWLPVCEE